MSNARIAQTAIKAIPTASRVAAASTASRLNFRRRSSLLLNMPPTVARCLRRVLRLGSPGFVPNATRYDHVPGSQAVLDVLPGVVGIFSVLSQESSTVGYRLAYSGEGRMHTLRHAAVPLSIQGGHARTKLGGSVAL